MYFQIPPFLISLGSFCLLIVLRTIISRSMSKEKGKSGEKEADQHLGHLEIAFSGLQKDNQWLRTKVSDLEGHSQRQNVRIMGLPLKSIEGRRPTIFSQHLVEVSCHQILSSLPELDRALRIPAPKSASGQRPHPVILRFRHYQVKYLVIRESRKKGVLTYQGHMIPIFERL